MADTPAPSLADIDPQRDYTDWRDEVLSLAEGTQRTYYGWTGPDGRRHVAVLRGAVMSPLLVEPPAVPAGRETFAWGGPGPGAGVLAWALLVDALGEPAPGGGAPRDSCGEWLERLIPVFVDEVVAALPPDGFELSGAGVRAWSDRHRCLRPEAVARPAERNGKPEAPRPAKALAS